MRQVTNSICYSMDLVRRVPTPLVLLWISSCYRHLPCLGDWKYPNWGIYQPDGQSSDFLRLVGLRLGAFLGAGRRPTLRLGLASSTASSSSSNSSSSRPKNASSSSGSGSGSASCLGLLRLFLRWTTFTENGSSSSGSSSLVSCVSATGATFVSES